MSSPFAAFSSHRPGFTPHLARLEAESIDIMREVAAEFRNPVMLYSIGKDSGVMLHLALKAFYPGQAAVPAAACRHDVEIPRDDRVPRRDRAAARARAASSTSTRTASRAASTRSPPARPLHTQVMKTEALKQALDSYGFDAAFGGARRDEEKSRAKERIFSFRTAGHGWDPRNQRPELWHLYNTRIRQGRVDPRVPAVQLDRARHLGIHPGREHPGRAALFRQAARRWCERDGTLIMVDDERMPLVPGETPRDAQGALPHARLLSADRRDRDPSAATLRRDRRRNAGRRAPPSAQGRLIDTDEAASMEKKKREGYF